MNNIFRCSFRYIATRYEEWQGGMCINKGRIETEITAEVTDDEIIRFNLEDAEELRILKDFEFELTNPKSESLPGRVQYFHSTSDFNPVVPIVCHIFHKDGEIEYVRFAMTNPDRLIEFYGYTVEISQPHRLAPEAPKDYSNITAESIMDELKSYGMYETPAIFERAVTLFWDNAKLESEDQIRLMVESHKLFVETYRLAYKENKEEQAGNEPVCLPKVYLFLGYCNFKLGNITKAYFLVKLAEESLDEVLRTSMTMFSSAGIRDVVGGKEIDEFKHLLESKYPEEIQSANYNEDPLDLDIEHIRELGKPTKNEIRAIIETIKKICANISKYADEKKDNDLVFKTFQCTKMLEMYTYPLLYAWQLFKYGWHSDFWKEGDSMFEYMMFEIDAKEMTEQLLDTLQQDSPFTNFEHDKAITKGLTKIYSYLLRNMPEVK